jgi:hypothetical protein
MRWTASPVGSSIPVSRLNEPSDGYVKRALFLLLPRPWTLRGLSSRRPCYEEYNGLTLPGSGAAVRWLISCR